jgi:choline dehydrogenase-like flavoprotein
VFHSWRAGWVPATINNGSRSDSATAYLGPAKSRRNLSVLVDATATKLLSTSKQYGNPVVNGVQFTSGLGSKLYTATARKEIILSAGAFNTPKLLQLSGIGDAAKLKKMGIKSLANLPSVGQNMSDHVLLGNRRVTRFTLFSVAYSRSLGGLLILLWPIPSTTTLTRPVRSMKSVTGRRLIRDLLPGR